jgi:hypothetical protein
MQITGRSLKTQQKEHKYSLKMCAELSHHRRPTHVKGWPSEFEEG